MRKVKRARRMAQLAMDKPLPIIRFDISQYSENLLREPSNRAVEFCKKTIDIHTHLLKLSAAEANTACLASNQVMLESSLIAINQKMKNNQSKQRGMNWIDLSYILASDYRVYHCPKVLKGKQLIQHVEESISYPFILFKVKRYNNIVIEFKDEYFRKQEAELTDFQAWAFQQSQEQLKGQSLLDWRINQGKIQFNSQVTQYFPKSVSVIEEYVQDLAKTFKQYPKLLFKPQNFGHPTERRNELQNEVLSYQADFYKRLTKHYQRQMGYLEQRINQGFSLDGQKQKWKEPKDIKVKVIDK